MYEQARLERIAGNHAELLRLGLNPGGPLCLRWPAPAAARGRPSKGGTLDSSSISASASVPARRSSRLTGLVAAPRGMNKRQSVSSQSMLSGQPSAISSGLVGTNGTTSTSAEAHPDAASPATTLVQQLFASHSGPGPASAASVQQPVSAGLVCGLSMRADGRRCAAEV